MENQEVIYIILGVIYGFCMFAVGYIIGHADANDERDEWHTILCICSIISADNDEFGLTEDQKQEILHREKESDDWSYILECMPEDVKGSLIKFFSNDSKTVAWRMEKVLRTT